MRGEGLREENKGKVWGKVNVKGGNNSSYNNK